MVNGGTLVVNHRQIDAWDADFLGIEKPLGRSVLCRGWQKADKWDCELQNLDTSFLESRLFCTGGGQKPHSKSIFPECFYYPEVTVKNAEVMAWDSRNAKPVVVQKTVGKGRVITILADWNMTPGQEKFLKLGQWLMDIIHSEVYPVSVEGSPVHYTTNRLDDALVVTVMNNKTFPWCGTVRIKADALEGIDVSQIGDWWRDRAYDPSQLRREGDKFAIDITVPPSKFIVLGIGHEIIEEEYHDLSYTKDMKWGDDPDEKIKGGILFAQPSPTSWGRISSW